MTQSQIQQAVMMRQSSVYNAFANMMGTSANGVGGFTYNGEIKPNPLQGGIWVQLENDSEEYNYQGILVWDDETKCWCFDSGSTTLKYNYDEKCYEINTDGNIIKSLPCSDTDRHITLKFENEGSEYTIEGLYFDCVTGGCYEYAGDYQRTVIMKYNVNVDDNMLYVQYDDNNPEQVNFSLDLDVFDKTTNTSTERFLNLDNVGVRLIFNDHGNINNGNFTVICSDITSPEIQFNKFQNVKYNMWNTGCKNGAGEDLSGSGESMEWVFYSTDKCYSISYLGLYTFSYTEYEDDDLDKITYYTTAKANITGDQDYTVTFTKQDGTKETFTFYIVRIV